MKFSRLVCASIGTLVVFVITVAGSLQAQTIFDDSFTDGDRAATEATDTSWWTSNASGGIEASVGQLGLVTGPSGRGIHTVFETQTLTEIGDSLTATITFTTPATIGSSSSSLRIGLFDTLDRALDQDIEASTAMPNVLYGISGTADGLPGYMFDIDVNSGFAADLNFREHNIENATGRLMGTTGTGSFTSFSSGPDESYTFDPNTSYTVTYTVTLVSPGVLRLAGTLGDIAYSVADDSVNSTSFGFLGFHVNSNTFGSSDVAGEPDNGLDFTNISVVFTPGPTPQPVFDDSFADGDRAATEATDTNWWTSATTAGIEAEVGSLGLVTGTSGRGIHTVFDTRTLSEVGDRITATYTFTTPATVGSSGSSFRVGLFDTLDRALDEDVNASSSMPNPVYGLAGTADGLPGFMMDMDVNTGASADLNFREHNIGAASGRLLATTSGFTSLGSGQDAGYTFDPNTTYTGSISVELLTPTQFAITGTIGGTSHSVTADVISPNFGMLAFHANSNVFGSTNVAGEPDNGIDFSNIVVTYATSSTGPLTVTPTTVTATRGTYFGGDETDLADSDNSDYQLRRSNTDIQSRTEFEVKATSPTETPTSMEFTLEGGVFARTNVVQTIELFDYDAAAWVEFDSRNANRIPNPDSVVTIAATGDLARFVEDGTRCIEARIRYQSDNPRQGFASNTDQTIWVIE